MVKDVTLKGRFAPSPSGPLHFGSLTGALASYADIKKRNGKWLVRIEDIDPPREMEGASSQILAQLAAHGLLWDEEVLYQSTRLNVYVEILTSLAKRKLTYHCSCSRSRIRVLQGIYDEHCRERNLKSEGNATRIIVQSDLGYISFTDQICGPKKQKLSRSVGDFVIQRRDGLTSYQLAVAIDDNFQGITDIMRGSDLLDSTHRQIFLQRCLGFPQPNYAHLPLAVTPDGIKLSKQNLASGLQAGKESKNLWEALNWLNQEPPVELKKMSPADIIKWSVNHWDRTKLLLIPNQRAPIGY